MIVVGRKHVFRHKLVTPCVEKIQHLLNERFPVVHRVLRPQVIFGFFTGVVKDPSNYLVIHRKAISGTEKNAEEINLRKKVD